MFKKKIKVVIAVLLLMLNFSLLNSLSSINQQPINREKILSKYITHVYAAADIVKKENNLMQEKQALNNGFNVVKNVHESIKGVESEVTIKLNEYRKEVEEQERIRKEEEQKRLEEEARQREEERKKERVYNLTESGEKGVYQNYAYSFFDEYGWSVDDYEALIILWNRESGWNPSARNPSSGAHGICQSLPAEKMASEGADYLTNYETQIRWGIKYIANRYGTPSNALAHSYSHNWY